MQSEIIESTDAAAVAEAEERIIRTSVNHLLLSRYGRDALEGLNMILQAAHRFYALDQLALSSLIESAQGPGMGRVQQAIYEALNRNEVTR